MAEPPQLGARGGGWVVLQFAVMAATLVLGFLGPDWPDGVSSHLGVVGLGVATLGIAIVLLAGRALGAGLTPFPSPSERAALVERGPYRAVRHPIYAGGVLFFAGIALDASPLALAGAAVLAVVWGLKARVEERFLTDRYPAYVGYCERTRYRLLPLVY